MPPKRRSGRKAQSPAKATAVAQEEEGEPAEHGEQAEQGKQGEQTETEQGEQTETKQGEQTETEQGEQGEKEMENAVDLKEEQDMGEDALDQMLQFDDSMNENAEANGIDLTTTAETEPQPSESVDETAADDGEQEAAETNEEEAEEEEPTQQEGEGTGDEDGNKDDTSEDTNTEKDTTEKKDSKTTEQDDQKKSWFLTDAYIKRNLVFKQYMRKEIGADIRLKTVLIFPVTLLDVQDTTLLSYIQKSHRFLLNFNDRLKKHNTEGFLSMSFHTVKEADEAAESLKIWREGLTVRRMHPPESVDKAMNDMKGFDPAMETHCMVFVKFLPDDATQEALDELIPGSTSVVIARNDDGVQRNYGYLTYETAEEAKAAAEKCKDIEMGGKKLLVVHYGSYTDPVSPTTAMADTKRVHMLHQYRNLKALYETKRSTMSASYKQQTEGRIEMLKSRLEKDAEMRLAEKKPVLGLDQLPPKKPKIQDTYNSYTHVPSKLLPAPRPLATPPMKRKNKPFQGSYNMGATSRWQNQQMGGMGMGGSSMLGAGGMMAAQPDATVKAVNMLVGLISNQLNQQQQPQQQQPQQQWGGFSGGSGGSSYGATTAYGSNSSSASYGGGGYGGSGGGGGSSNYTSTSSNSSRWNQWGNSSGSSYSSGGAGLGGSSYRGSGGSGYGSSSYQGLGGGLGSQGGWNKNKRKSGGGGGQGAQWKGKKGRWN